MNKSVIVANSVESKGVALDETGRPNLSSVLDILAYLAETSDAMKDTGEPSRKGCSAIQSILGFYDQCCCPRRVLCSFRSSRKRGRFGIHDVIRACCRRRGLGMDR